MARKRKAKRKGFTLQDYRRLVKQAGGAAKAAKLMGVTQRAAEAHGRGKRAGNHLSIAKVRMLRAALGDLETPEIDDSDRGVCYLVPLEKLKTVRSLPWKEHEDGYQRPVSLKAVAEIEALVRSGQIEFGPLMLGKIPGKGKQPGEVYEIDGQHRRRGFIAAEQPHWAIVFECRDLDHIRYLYLKHNSASRKVSMNDRFGASRNPTKATLAKWQKKYNASFKQVHAVACGLLKAVDYVEPDSAIPEDLQARGALILAAWSSDSRWSPKKGAPSIFNGTHALKAIAVVSKDYSPENLKKVLKILRDAQKQWQRKGTVDKMIRDGTPRDLIEWMRTYVTPRIMGGVTGTKASRPRRRPRAAS